MKMKMRRMDNKGFSLVELLIAIAIASIVGGAVFGFMRVGARTFSFNSADVNLQSESQLAFNQMQDLIIDTAVGIQYFAKTGTGFDEDSSDLRRVSSDSEIASTEDKLLRLYNVEDVYDIWWDRDEGKLYYNEWKADGASDIKKPINLTDASAPHDELMSEYITDFNVDLSRLSQRVVRIDFKYEKGDRIQAYSHNITLRNQIVSGNTIEERLRDAFRVSENVVPDNIKGKDIIYAEPGDTVDLTSIVDDGATGLTGYHVYDVANVEIPTSGAGAKETLHYGFTTTSSHKSGYTTVGYNSGSLYIHPTETVGEFQVLIYCQSNNAVAKVVNVRVVRTTSISINFIAGEGKNNELDNGASGDDAYSDDLKADETFKLQATPFISWTESATPAAEMSPNDKTKLQTIESSINSGIYFKGLTGYPSLFKATGSLNSGINPCEFKMLNNLTFGVGEAEYYTTPISARAICGYSESKSRDVHKDWDGTAYKKKADFTITYKNNIQRGAPQYIYKTNATFECDEHKDSAGGFWANHVQLLEVEAIERDYSQTNDDGTTPKLRPMERAEYIRNFTLSNGEEGNTITWKCPVEWRLDCEYEFRFTMHIAPVKNGVDASKGIYVLPYAGYTKADYEFTSNTTPPVVFHRFSLSYREKENYNNVDVEEIAKEPIDSDTYVDEGNHVTYYARNFQEYSPRGTKKLGYYELENNIKTEEYNSYREFPGQGNSNNVYVDKSANMKYGWDGSKYYVCEQFEAKKEFPTDGEAGHIYFSKIRYERINYLQLVEKNTKEEFPKPGEKFNRIYYAKDTAKKYIWDGSEYYPCEYSSKDAFPYKSVDGSFLKDYVYLITKSGEYDHEIYRITDKGEYYRFTRNWVDDPIILPISLNNEFTWRTDVWKALIESKSAENSGGKWKVYKPVYGSDGSYTWEEYTGRNFVCDYNMDPNNIPKNKIMFKYFTAQEDGGYLNMNLYRDYINKDIPARLRICPFITWVGNNAQGNNGEEYETRDYVIDNNYVECVFWNIKIPYKSLLGKLYQTTGWGGSYDMSYFPGPDEPNFPGKKSTATRWYCAGYGNDAGYITTTADDGGEFYELRYTLTEVSNYNAPSTWKLKLMYEAGGHENEDLATYIYNTKTKMWDLTQ